MNKSQVSKVIICAFSWSNLFGGVVVLLVMARRRSAVGCIRPYNFFCAAARAMGQTSNVGVSHCKVVHSSTNIQLLHTHNYTNAGWFIARHRCVAVWPLADHGKGTLFSFYSVTDSRSVGMILTMGVDLKSWQWSKFSKNTKESRAKKHTHQQFLK